MSNIFLNYISKNENSWFCNVFEFDKINTGGIFINNEDYENISVEPFSEFNYRYYKKSKKIVISANNFQEYKFCALDFAFDQWKCLICRKLCRRNQNCFCKPYSNCWSPIDAKITGLLFSNVLEFNYLNSEDEVNIIL
jgi:hypothetical protein